MAPAEVASPPTSAATSAPAAADPTTREGRMAEALKDYESSKAGAPATGKAAPKASAKAKPRKAAASAKSSAKPPAAPAKTASAATR